MTTDGIGQTEFISAIRPEINGETDSGQDLSDDQFLALWNVLKSSDNQLDGEKLYEIEDIDDLKELDKDEILEIAQIVADAIENKDLDEEEKKSLNNIMKYLIEILENDDNNLQNNKGENVKSTGSASKTMLDTNNDGTVNEDDYIDSDDIESMTSLIQNLSPEEAANFVKLIPDAHAREEATKIILEAHSDDTDYLNTFFDERLSNLGATQLETTMEELFSAFSTSDNEESHEASQKIQIAFLRYAKSQSTEKNDDSLSNAIVNYLNGNKDKDFANNFFDNSVGELDLEEFLAIDLTQIPPEDLDELFNNAPTDGREGLSSVLAKDQAVKDGLSTSEDDDFAGLLKDENTDAAVDSLILQIEGGTLDVGSLAQDLGDPDIDPKVKAEFLTKVYERLSEENLNINILSVTGLAITLSSQVLAVSAALVLNSDDLDSDTRSSIVRNMTDSQKDFELSLNDADMNDSSDDNSDETEAAKNSKNVTEFKEKIKDIPNDVAYNDSKFEAIAENLVSGGLNKEELDAVLSDASIGIAKRAKLAAALVDYIGENISELEQGDVENAMDILHDFGKELTEQAKNNKELQPLLSDFLEELQNTYGEDEEFSLKYSDLDNVIDKLRNGGMKGSQFDEIIDLLSSDYAVEGIGNAKYKNCNEEFDKGMDGSPQRAAWLLWGEDRKYKDTIEAVNGNTENADQRTAEDIGLIMALSGGKDIDSSLIPPEDTSTRVISDEDADNIDFDDVAQRMVDANFDSMAIMLAYSALPPEAQMEFMDALSEKILENIEHIPEEALQELLPFMTGAFIIHEEGGIADSGSTAEFLQELTNKTLEYASNSSDDGKSKLATVLEYLSDTGADLDGAINPIDIEGLTDSQLAEYDLLDSNGNLDIEVFIDALEDGDEIPTQIFDSVKASLKDEEVFEDMTSDEEFKQNAFLGFEEAVADILNYNSENGGSLSAYGDVQSFNQLSEVATLNMDFVNNLFSQMGGFLKQMSEMRSNLSETLMGVAEGSAPH